MFFYFSRFIYIIYIIFYYKLFMLIFFKKKFFLNKIILNIKNIRLGFEKMGPIFIKLGQVISTRSDILSNEIINEFKNLQDSVDFIGFDKIKHIIEKSLRIKINDHFLKINENPLASASVAQVHAAVLKNNNKVLIKVLKPNVEKIIFFDLNFLKFIFFILSFFIKDSIKILLILDELNFIFKNEINLKYEACYINKFKQNFSKNVFFYAPNVYWDFVAESVLVLEYLDGINILNYKKIMKENISINDLIYKLVESFYIQFLKYNFFHADFHPGNILISKNNTSEFIIIFIDFGIVGFIDDNQKFYLVENIISLIERDYIRMIKLHIKSYTIHPENDIKKIECEIRCVFDPILDKSLKEISFDKTFSSLMALLKKIKFEIQPKFLLFQKTLISLESIVRKLNNDINLWFLTIDIIKKIFAKNIILNELYYKFKSLLNKIEEQEIERKKVKIKYNLFLRFINFILSDSFFNFLVLYFYMFVIFVAILEYYQFIIIFL